MAVFSFYLVSFLGMYLVFILGIDDSNFSMEMSKNVKGQNGAEGFLIVAFFISVAGGVLLLVNFICGNIFLKAAKEFEQKGIFAGLKMLFLGK